ncbi:DUF5361 domain-containing protein [Lachnospiraceae bacterium ZAX-1]
MMKEGKDELVCDFAEYYHVNLSEIENYKLSYIATLALGLREDSRTRMKMSNRKYSMSTQLAGFQIDLLQYLVWFQTKDASKGRNRPNPILKEKEKKNTDHLSFGTAEEFEAKMREIKNGN